MSITWFRLTLATFWNFFPSNSGIAWMQYSSTGSVRKRTSYPLARRRSTNGDCSTWMQPISNQYSDSPSVPFILFLPYLLSASSSNIEDSFLLVLHSLNVGREGSLFLSIGRREESTKYPFIDNLIGSIFSPLSLFKCTNLPEEFSESHSVGRIFHHTQLDIGRELLPELIKLLSIELLQHIENLTYQLLLDNLHKNHN